MTAPDDGVPDEQLAARAQHDRREAFDQLIHRHKTTLYRFVRRYVGQSDDAYDVLQDTFIAAWVALKRYDPARPFLPWLRMIALNKCRDFGRRQAVRRLMLRAQAVDPLRQTSESAREPGLGLPREDEHLRRLDIAIAALPAAYKEPLLLTTVGGLSQQEAADVLKTSVKAIEMRLYRARQKLLLELGEDREG